MIKRIEKFVYRLQLSTNMRIHNVISITQLKSITNSVSNSYKRKPSSLLFTLLNEDEIKRFIRKRTRHIKRSKNKIIEYFIR